MHRRSALWRSANEMNDHGKRGRTQWLSIEVQCVGCADEKA